RVGPAPAVHGGCPRGQHLAHEGLLRHHPQGPRRVGQGRRGPARPDLLRDHPAVGGPDPGRDRAARLHRRRQRVPHRQHLLDPGLGQDRRGRPVRPGVAGAQQQLRGVRRRHPHPRHPGGGAVPVPAALHRGRPDRRRGQGLTTMSSSLLAQPHHDGAPLHAPTAAPAPGEAVGVFLRVPRDDGCPGAWARTPPDAEPHLLAGTVDRETASETWWRFDITVRNPLTGYRFLLGGGPRGYRWRNGTGVHTHDVTDAGDFLLSSAAPPPAWARDAVVYQVFPDRFARSAGADGRPVPAWAQPAGWDDPVGQRGPGAAAKLYGGDLDGITEHLDHLAEVGINALYLTPFFPAESNHRYNASSFEEVDPLLGGDKALARLSQEVHGRGWPPPRAL